MFADPNLLSEYKAGGLHFLSELVSSGAFPPVVLLYQMRSFMHKRASICVGGGTRVF